ncbi:MAG TPA: ATP-binding cassette domain-containing protein, partial [Candidatus Nanopelagicales bacterium]|nr:ATP-binding cassette domain-containing protein [Candidatus Nanopelagicales bacterium]
MTRGLAAKVGVARGSFRLDVDLAVSPGEVVAVLGPNGAGKSTLLRTVCGLVPIDTGLIELDGVVVDHPASDAWVDVAQRRVGVVFQDYRLFPHLSVLDNVAFGPSTLGRSRTRARADARGWIARLGLEELADRRPSQISGGQAQRVARARALASD